MSKKCLEFKSFLKNTDKFKIFFESILLLSSIIQIIAIVLDIVSLFELRSDSSIAFIQFDPTGYYSNLTTAYTSLASIYGFIITCLFFLILVKDDFHDFVIVYSLPTLILYPIKEILFYLVITCFKQDLGFLITRVIFNFFFIILILSPHFRILNLIRIGKKFRKKKYQVYYSFFFASLIIVLFLSFIINIGLLTRIKPRNQTLNDVNIGLFNENEIAKIERMEYEPDGSLKYRKLVQYSKVVKNSRFIRSQCDETSSFPNCTSLYGFSFSIECDAENKKFLLDCADAKSLDFGIISYRDTLSGNERSYPEFNCAVRLSNNNCLRECSNVLKYNLYFFKSTNDKLLPAWNEFHTCSKNQTSRFILNRNRNIRICQVFVSSSYIQKSNIILVFLMVFFFDYYY